MTYAAADRLEGESPGCGGRIQQGCGPWPRPRSREPFTEKLDDDDAAMFDERQIGARVLPAKTNDRVMGSNAMGA